MARQGFDTGNIDELIADIKLNRPYNGDNTQKWELDRDGNVMPLVTAERDETEVWNELKQVIAETLAEAKPPTTTAGCMRWLWRVLAIISAMTGN